MKSLIIAFIVLFSVVAFADANVYFIGQNESEPRCWQGNCKIVVEDGNVSQCCDAFCNFYCYKGNYKIVCNDEKCWNDYDFFCLIDGGPHQVKSPSACK